jgi:signal transduction histidine kinase
MAEEQMGEAVPEFSQASSATASKYGSTGFGLAIRKRWGRGKGTRYTVAKFN